MMLLSSIFMGLLTGIFSNNLLVMILTALTVSIFIMIYELVRGIFHASIRRKQLGEVLNIDFNNETSVNVLEAALLRDSIQNQYVYKFHLIAFIGGCVITFLPIVVSALIVFGIKLLF